MFPPSMLVVGSLLVLAVSGRNKSVIVREEGGLIQVQISKTKNNPDVTIF